ncbi:MAG: glycine--tRNA ligase subunit beta, partial [Gammaproteobacteria bacterium]
MATRDFLLEIGTEELPPIALEGLSRALESSLCAQLSSAGLDYSGSARFATPRRLAVLVSDLGESQPDRTIERFGPAVSAAFDSDGKATPAALGFARSCGVSVDALARADKDGVEKLLFHGEEKGAASSSLLPAMVQEAVNRLPVPKPMRWGIGREEFVRPVHWIVMLFGSETLSANILGQAAGNQTWGHRFHHNVAIALSDPGDYEKALDQARVIASFSRRRDRVRELVIAQADQLGARA